MKELEALLENFWIVKDKEPALYHAVKDAVARYSAFTEDKLGYRLLVNPWLIKLEKLPGRPEAWMGVPGFESETEYGMLCLLLAFLEDRGPGEQFVLSQVTGYIESAWPDRERIEWVLFRHRRQLIRVLRFAAQYDLIRVDDGDDSRFMDAADAEVLYESTGISRYFVRNFMSSIFGCESRKDIEEMEWAESDRDRGKARRNRVYRRLVMSPAVYNEGDDDADYLYIKNIRNTIAKDLDEMLQASLHVHRNGAFLVPDPAKRWKDTFPDGATRSNVVLQINLEIRRMVTSGELTKQQDDTIPVSAAWFDALIGRCREMHARGWSKEYREMGLSALCETVVGYMEDFSMLRRSEDGREIVILPMCGKIVGGYSEENTARLDGLASAERNPGKDGDQGGDQSEETVGDTDPAASIEDNTEQTSEGNVSAAGDDNDQEAIAGFYYGNGETTNE